MKKTVLLSCCLLLFFASYPQNQASEFETVLRSGNSAKAFQFVRNIFGVPEAKDPFLHFKERGITQLISFYDHSEKKIEATSLIRFDQTRAFWTNYSKQFTAGKWNYKNLYKNDSLAWLAANYSITLIYAHEMGHYMSYNLVYDFHEDYTCEELVANQCLAAFANTFNGNKTFDKHKQLFLSLARQTYTLIPDSNKTGFTLPMEDWCASNTMKAFFDYFETDQTRFLRMYGYSQFRMIEAALGNYKAGSMTNFLNTTFYDFYNNYTPAGHFKPLRYKVLSKKEYKNAQEVTYYIDLVKRETGNFFRPNILTDLKYHFDTTGQLLESIIVDEEENYADTIESNDFSIFSLVNRQRTDSSATILHNFIYADSVSNYHSPGRTIYPGFEIISAFQNDSSFYYLIRHSQNIFTGLELDSSFTDYEILYLKKRDNKYFMERFPVPDSFYHNDQMENQELFLAGVNNGPPFLISNELTKEHKQVLTIYPVSIEPLGLAKFSFPITVSSKGYFNMQYPTIYYDWPDEWMKLCFWSPVTSSIYLFKFTAGKTQGFELYERSFQGSYGPKMQVVGLRLAGNNKLYVFAKTRKPGNTTKAVMQKLVLQW